MKQFPSVLAAFISAGVLYTVGTIYYHHLTDSLVIHVWFSSKPQHSDTCQVSLKNGFDTLTCHST